MVLIASKPLCLGAMAEESNALLVAFNAGQYGGQALAEALLGLVNPCGKLPISFPRHTGQNPVYYNSLPGWHGERYADLPAGPQFAFGEGISYTSFRLTDAAFDPLAQRLTFKVKNTGERKGSTIAQVYFRDVVSSVLTPVKQLIAFEKIELSAGEERDVLFQLTEDAYALIDSNGKRVTEPGDFVLMVGFSSAEKELIQIPFRLG